MVYFVVSSDKYNVFFYLTARWKWLVVEIIQVKIDFVSDRYNDLWYNFH